MWKGVTISLALLVVAATVCPKVCLSHKIEVAKHDCCPESQSQPEPQKNCCSQHVTDSAIEAMASLMPVVLSPVVAVLPVQTIVLAKPFLMDRAVHSVGPPIYLTKSVFLI